MNTPRRFALSLCSWLVISSGGVGLAQSPPPRPARSETLETPDGRRSVGRLVETPDSVWKFAPAKGEAPLPIRSGDLIAIDAPDPDTPILASPFRVNLGAETSLSGRSATLDASTIRLDRDPGRPPLTIQRSGAMAIVQRSGEIQVLHEGFETLDAARWTLGGLPEITDQTKFAGTHALRLPAGGSSLTTRIDRGFSSGRFDLEYHDNGVRSAGQRWFVDLSFRRGNAGLSTIRAVLGWAEETLAVESPEGPALNVQLLARKPGWHHLSVRFDENRAILSVDGDELAHGVGPGGPLVEIRIATEVLGAAQPAADLAAVIDELQLIRFVEPSGRGEIDPAQDEVRLVSGDQLFGEIVSAGKDRITLKLDGHDIRRPWSEVAGLWFRRTAAPSELLSGQWVRAEWKTAPGADPRDLDRAEAVLVALSEDSAKLAIPYVGTIEIPRDRLRRLVFLDRCSRLIIDPFSHHLGDRETETLDPPHAETTPLEQKFSLGQIPDGAAGLSLDVLEVVGEEGTPVYSELVKKGQLRTRITINGTRLDDLNLHVRGRNDTPRRIQVPIPGGLLKVGSNVLRFEQTGSVEKPDQRDNLGILKTAIEFRPTQPESKKP